MKKPNHNKWLSKIRGELKQTILCKFDELIQDADYHIDELERDFPTCDSATPKEFKQWCLAKLAELQRDMCANPNPYGPKRRSLTTSEFKALVAAKEDSPMDYKIVGNNALIDLSPHVWIVPKEFLWLAKKLLPVHMRSVSVAVRDEQGKPKYERDTDGKLIKDAAGKRIPIKEQRPVLVKKVAELQRDGSTKSILIYPHRYYANALSWQHVAAANGNFLDWSRGNLRIVRSPEPVLVPAAKTEFVRYFEEVPELD